MKIKEKGRLRKKAEGIMQVKLSHETLNYSEADSLKLIHELQVHQIELELVNEELEKAKEQVEVTAEKYAELYFAPMGYFTLSRKGVITDVNPSGAQMLKKQKSFLINKAFFSFVSIDSQPTFTLFLEKIFESPMIESCELTLVSNGADTYLYLNGLCKENSEYCQIVAIDITARKTAEKEIMRLLSELKITKDRLEMALENGNIGVWEWDLNSDEMIWDDRMEKIFGIEPGSFKSKLSSFEELVNEEDWLHTKKALQNSLENDIPFETVFRTRAENSKDKYINSKALVNKDKDGKPVSMAGVCFDVTSLREGTDQIIVKLNDELLRSNRELETFAYVASHDLQEPLRMISTFTQLLSHQYREKLDDKAKEYMRYTVDGATRMFELINGLLTYSRVHTKGKAHALIDTNRVIEAVTNNISVIIKERGAVIKADNLPPIFADENQMIQLFQNLIINSVKFSKNSPEIFISSKTESNHFVFSVRDNGIGIDPQYYRKIFLIFQRLIPNEYEGTGIGLSICKRIVERHGGTIWVESKPGEGSTFFFTIPKPQ